MDKSGNLKTEKTPSLLKEDLDKIIQNEWYPSFQNLPADVKERGHEMAEAYLYLCCIENTIRVFIEKVGKETFGEGYFAKLSVSPKTVTEIHNRKSNAEKNKWLSVRGGSDLYYVDFKDLGELMANNWGVFDKYFPGQNWIKQKIDELGNIRNLVAHNGFINDHEKEILKVNFHSILKQING